MKPAPARWLDNGAANYNLVVRQVDTPMKYGKVGEIVPFGTFEH
jgi:hypothetical protein